MHGDSLSLSLSLSLSHTHTHTHTHTFKVTAPLEAVKVQSDSKSVHTVSWKGTADTEIKVLSVLVPELSMSPSL